LISLEEGQARLDGITVNDNSTDCAASELLGTDGMAQRLGVSVAILVGWRDDGRAVALRNSANEYVYPTRQFDRSRPIDGLDRVVGYFPSSEEVWDWLVAPDLYTDSKAPIDQLRSGHFEAVIRAADGMLDYQ
jgi:hypothetical protein